MAYKLEHPGNYLAIERSVMEVKIPFVFSIGKLVFNNITYKALKTDLL